MGVAIGLFCIAVFFLLLSLHESRELHHENADLRGQFALVCAQLDAARADALNRRDVERRASAGYRVLATPPEPDAKALADVRDDLARTTTNLCASAARETHLRLKIYALEKQILDNERYDVRHISQREKREASR